MLASNPVDPSQQIAISYHRDHGPSSAWPRRDDERGLGNTLAVFGAAALLAIGYVVGGIATASTPATVTGGPVPVEQDGGIGGPAAKQGGAPVATPVVGEFRLGPGNNDAPGIVAPVAPVAPVAMPSAVPGEFRLGPGNNEAPGLVPGVGTGGLVVTGGVVLPDDLHGADIETMSADEILPFK